MRKCAERAPCRYENVGENGCLSPSHNKFLVTLYTMLSHSVCPTLSNPMDCSSPEPVHGDSPGNTGVGCHALLQGLHCRHILYHLSAREALHTQQLKC